MESAKGELGLAITKLIKETRVAFFLSFSVILCLLFVLSELPITVVTTKTQNLALPRTTRRDVKHGSFGQHR